jgi:hypothetical protein
MARKMLESILKKKEIEEEDVEDNDAQNLCTEPVP